MPASLPRTRKHPSESANHTDDACFDQETRDSHHHRHSPSLCVQKERGQLTSLIYVKEHKNSYIPYVQQLAMRAIDTIHKTDSNQSLSVSSGFGPPKVSQLSFLILLRSSWAFIWFRVNFFFFLTAGVLAASPSAPLAAGVACAEAAGDCRRERAYSLMQRLVGVASFYRTKRGEGRVNVCIGVFVPFRCENLLRSIGGRWSEIRY